MTTVGTLVDTTLRQHLEMAGPSGLNRLQSTINASVETLTLDWEADPELGPGTYIEIGTEVLLVTQATETSVGVLRGQHGTTAASHTAGDLIRVQPRFLRSQVLTEMQDEIRSWPRSLFGVTRVDITWPASTYDVDLTGALGKDVIRLLEVRLQPDGDEPWYDLESSVRVFPASTSDFASGWRLHTLRDASSGTVEITYAHGFTTTTLSESTDLEGTVGLSSSMLDIARLGAAARLLYSQEGERARLDLQGQTRFAEEVPPQHQATAAEALMKLRDKRMQDEEERLISRWGVV